MTTYKKKPDFFTSDEGVMAAAVLSSMVLDSSYVTEPSFSADTAKYADNLIPFVDKHLAYLRDHPALKTEHYLANLKLKTRTRR